MRSQRPAPIAFLQQGVLGDYILLILERNGNWTLPFGNVANDDHIGNLNRSETLMTHLNNEYRIVVENPQLATHQEGKTIPFLLDTLKNLRRIPRSSVAKAHWFRLNELPTSDTPVDCAVLERMVERHLKYLFGVEEGFGNSVKLSKGERTCRHTNNTNTMAIGHCACPAN